MTLRAFAVMTSICLGLGLVMAACGGGSTGGGDGGHGGTSGAMGGMAGGTGAAGGSSGSLGGTSGTVANCGQLPTCVASVVAACAPAGACLVAAPVSGTHDVCYGNGVKAVNVVMSDVNTGAGTESITFQKGGVPCYSLEGTFNSNSTDPEVLTFKDAAGTALATFTIVDINSTIVTCGGVSTTVTDFGNCGMPTNPEGTFCLGGVCTP